MKNGKKIALAVTAGCMAVTMMVGGTLAWFTDKAESTNVITTGDVSISLTETEYEDGQIVTAPGQEGGIVVVRTDEGNDANDYFAGGLLEPGTKILKDPTVENTGTNDAYIRVGIDYSATAPAGVEPLGFDEFLDIASVTFNTAIDANGGAWLVDGANKALYYNKALKPDEVTGSIFAITDDPNGDYTIYFDGSKMGNDYTGMSFELKFTAEAIQTNNVGAFDGSTAESAAAFWANYSNVDFTTGLAA